MLFTATRTDNVCHITEACNSNYCYTCPFINTHPLVDSNSTGSMFISNATGTCASNNVVYMIECKKCGMQYIGETTQTLRQRFTQHRNNIIGGKNKTPLVRHFNSPGHSINDVSIKILEKFNNSHDIKNTLLQYELLWIKVLNTAFPFGMNDKISGYGCATEIINPSTKGADPYFTFKIPRKKRSHGARKRSRRVNNNFLQELQQLFANFALPAGVRSIYCFLKSQNKITIKHFTKFFNTNAINIDVTLKLVFMAYSAGYFRNLDLKKVHNDQTKIRIPVHFPNKGMEYINFANIWYDKSLIECLPDAIRNKVTISAVFKYDAPVSLSIFNYAQFLKGLTVRKLFIYSQKLCRCYTSPFKYEPSGHVITGNLKLVKCKGLKSILSKGAKYRLPKPIDLNEVKTAALNAIDIATAKLCNKFKLPISQYQDYKQKFCNILNSRLHHAKIVQPEITWYDYRELNRLQEQFIIVPADKAANNYIFVCKKYYAEVICSELGVSLYGKTLRCNGNGTYQHCPLTTEKIISMHVNINKQFGLNVNNQNLCLPRLFANPKIHKNPYSWRFIAGARNSSIKPISCLLQKVLKHFRIHLNNYCKVIKSSTGNAAFVSINSSQEAIAILDSIASKTIIKSVATFDFTSLFTSIPHSIILNSLLAITKLCLHNSRKTYLCVNGNNVYYTNKITTSGLCMNETDIFELITKTLEQTYVQFAGLNFKQVVGVPMGGNASSQIADLTLAYLEMEFFKKKNGVQISMCRYIDDLLVINTQDFLTIAKDIYPPELELKQTNLGPSEAVFLDIKLIILNARLGLNIYDKTDDFPFHVVKVGSVNSNVHSNIGYNMFYTQTIRFLRIANCSINLKSRLRKLYINHLEAGFQREKLVKSFFKLANRHAHLFYKFNIFTHLDILKLSAYVFAEQC